jgi:hypothetical protein
MERVDSDAVDWPVFGFATTYSISDFLILNASIRYWARVTLFWRLVQKWFS